MPSTVAGVSKNATPMVDDWQTEFIYAWETITGYFPLK